MPEATHWPISRFAALATPTSKQLTTTLSPPPSPGHLSNHSSSTTSSSHNRHPSACHFFTDLTTLTSRLTFSRLHTRTHTFLSPLRLSPPETSSKFRPPAPRTPDPPLSASHRALRPSEQIISAACHLLHPCRTSPSIVSFLRCSACDCAVQIVDLELVLRSIFLPDPSLPTL